MKGTVPLDGSSKRVDLGGGYALRAQGLSGTARVHGPRGEGLRGPEGVTTAFDEALSEGHFAEVRTIELQVKAVLHPAHEVPLRDAAGDDALILETPDLGAHVGQVVLSVDEHGVATWHFPLTDENKIQTPAHRGAGGIKRFRLRRHVSPPPADDEDKTRSLLTLLGRKILKVLVYKLTDPLLGPVSEQFARHWEAAKRPYGLRRMRPESYGAPGAPGLTPADWQQLRQGRALLFIHGTFSTAHGAFNQLPADLVATLHERYGQRLFAFNHFTLTHDPATNARWLLEQIPAEGSPLELDIVCHSRGGLVARMLSEAPEELEKLAREKVSVRRVILVGVPNSGTALAHPDHMVEMIDRFTTALNLLPTGHVAEALDAILALVKIVGHGALSGLDGLASMKPDGAFLKQLNFAPKSKAEYFAVAADYSPNEPALRAFLKKKMADALVDRIFEQNANDMVVPTRGVFEAASSPSFPIAADRLLSFESKQAVTHTTYFAQPKTVQALAKWLG